MVEEIVMIDKPIKSNLYYLEESTTLIGHCKSTGSRPFALPPLLLILFLTPVSHFPFPLPHPSHTVKLFPDTKRSNTGTVKGVAQ